MSGRVGKLIPASNGRKRSLGRLGLALWLGLGFYCASAGAGTSNQAFYDPDFLITHRETEHGLPENSATAMVQGADGSLWFGTFGGLVKFDGIDFEIFRSTDTPGLPSSGIVNLHLDASQRLWVSTYGGLVSREGDQWRRYTKDDGWTGDFVRTVAERKNGDLLFTTFDAQIFQYSSGRFTKLPSPGMAARSHAAFVDQDEQWCVAQEGFIGQWDGKQWVATIELAPGVKQVWAGGALGGGYWLVRDRLLSRHRGDSELSRVELPEHPGGVWSIHEDSAGNVWIATYDKGVCRVTPDGRMRRYGLGRGLLQNGVRFVFEDRECNVWIGTSGGGLTRLRPRLFQSFGVEAGLSEPNVTAVCAGAGQVWVGTYGGGLFRLDGTSMNPVELPKGATPNVQSLLHDRAGRLWVGMYGSGPCVIENGAARIMDVNDAGGHNGLALFEDSRGTVWLSGGQHVASFDGKSFRQYGNEESKPLYGVTGFAEGDDGAIYAVNHRVHRLTGERFEVVHQPAEPHRAVSISQDRDRCVWVGLSNGSLLQYRGGKSSEVSRWAGTGHGPIVGIMDDGDRMWLAATDAVLCIPRDRLHAAADDRAVRLEPRVFGVTHGLPSPHISSGRQSVCARDGQGRLWFATQKGAAMIDPSRARMDPAPAPVVRMRDLRYQAQREPGAPAEDGAADRTVLSNLTEPIALPPGSRQVEIRFAAPSFSAPELTQYLVRLNDDAWESIGARRSAHYVNLPPGEYRFSVRALNHDGVWSTAPATLLFSIQPFFWQTAWVRVGAPSLLALLAALGTWGIVASRRRMQRESDEQFRLVVEAAPSAMVMADDEGMIVLVNRQAESTFGYSREELIGQRVEMLIPARNNGRDNGRHDAPEAGFVAGPDSLPVASRETFGLRKDGSEIPIEVGLKPVHTAGGTQVLASIVDISERRRHELEMQKQRNELAHLSRASMLGELSGSLAHELNQPLAAILSNAQAAQRYLAKNRVNLTELREILYDIVEEDKRAGEVISRLRLLLKKGEVQRQAVNINEIVVEVLRFIRTDLINHGVTVETALAADVPDVDADRVQLQQVLINLIMNASDAMAGRGGKRPLRIETSIGMDRAVSLHVRDHGCGIPAEQIERVFDPFVTTKAKGLGLGLTVCRTIVTAHGGRLWATNNEDGGATFHVALPAMQGVL